MGHPAKWVLVMTDYYVDSVGGSNTSPYDTWAKAATAIVNLPGMTSVDRAYVASRHVEGATGTLGDSTWTATGLEEGGPEVISVTQGTTTYAAGAKLNSTTGGVQISNSGRYFGIIFEGVGFVQRRGAVQNEALYFYGCTCKVTTTNDYIDFGGAGCSFVEIDTTYEFEGSSSDTATGINVLNGSIGLSFNPSFVGVGFKDQIFIDNGMGQARYYGGDWSGWGASGGNVNIINSSAGTRTDVYLYGAKLPATYSLTAGATPGGDYNAAVHLIGSDDDTSNDRYNFEYATHTIEMSVDDTVWLDGANGFGPNDAPNNISWKITRCESDTSRFNPARLPPMVVYNTDTGATKTLTIELLVHRDAGSPTAPQDDEIFAYAAHQDVTSSVQVAISHMGAMNTPVDTPADLAAGTGLANWRESGSAISGLGDAADWGTYKLELSSTLDVDREGPVVVFMFIAGLSNWDEIYINPLPIIT